MNAFVTYVTVMEAFIPCPLLGSQSPFVMAVMYHLLLLIQREWSQGMGCVPSLPHPCSLKEEARFTFVYIIGAWLWGGDVSLISPRR